MQFVKIQDEEIGIDDESGRAHACDRMHALGIEAAVIWQRDDDGVTTCTEARMPAGDPPPTDTKGEHRPRHPEHPETPATARGPR